MTRDDLIAKFEADVKAAMPTNLTLTPTNVKPVLNASLGTIRYANDTVDPTLKPTVPHINDIQY